MKFLFFFLGVPIMIMSFFEAVDALPYVQSVDLIVDGHEIVLTEDEQSGLQDEVFALFENSRTMPAFGVVFDEMFQEEIQSGKYVSMKFGRPFEINNLPFDELVFRVEPEYQGFNLCRGMHGVFQGRCIYIDLNGNNMQSLANYIDTLPIEQISSETIEQIPETSLDEEPTEQNPVEDQIEQNPSEDFSTEELPNDEENLVKELSPQSEELSIENFANDEISDKFGESVEEIEKIE